MKILLAVGVVLLILSLCLPASAADGQTGAISVISSPKPADVYVDDLFVGVTDNAFVNILQGTHTVRVVKAGYDEYVAANVYVPGGPSANTVPMSANLQKSTDRAGLVVDSTPEGAVVYVDDVYRGTTHYNGLQIANLSAGTHTIRFEMDGYKPYTVTGYNTPSGSATYMPAVNLIPLATPTPIKTSAGPATTASVVLDSTPSAASVTLNNEFRGYTPLTLSGLVPGSYAVLVSHDGYTAWQTTLTVAAGDVVRQSAVLPPAAAVPTAPVKSPMGFVPVSTGILLAAGCLIFRH